MNVVLILFLPLAVVGTLLLRSPWLRGHRAETLTVVSLIFVLCSTVSIGDAACLVAMTATGWLAIRMVTLSKSRLLLAGAIGAVVLEFYVTRQILPHVAASPWLEIGPTIGLSYVMFRVLHLIVDAHGGELPDDLRPRDYICYLFCYLTFLAGPIQRFPEFSAGLGAEPAASWREAIRRWLPTIVAGCFKFTVLAGLFFDVFNWAQSPVSPCPPIPGLALSALCFALYLYLSFSGYTDIVRGFGGLIGLDLPNNFDKPFLAADFLDFWSRWHISLSEWFKLYVFNPLVKALIAASDRPALVPHLGAAGYFVTFLLMGLWHGVSVRFALYGVVLGVGVSVNKLHQTLMTQKLGRRRYREVASHPAYAAVARGLAVTYFVLALGFLWMTTFPSAEWSLFDGLAASLLLFGVVLMTGVVAAKVDTVLPASLGAVHRAVPMAWLVLLAGEGLIILVYLLVLHGVVPPLLYEFF